MIYPKNKLNDAIQIITDNAKSSVEEIVKLEEYYRNYNRNESEEIRLLELVELKKKLQTIAEIRFYKTPNFES